MSDRIAVYAGSFDIPTRGHLDMITRGAKLYDKLYVAATSNGSKNKGKFTLGERLGMLKEITGHLPNVEVVCFERELTVDWAKAHGAQVVLRGMRDGKDFAEECILCANNRKLKPEIETSYLLPSSDFTYISSSAVRELMDGIDDWEFRIGYLVPEPVHAKLIEKYGNRYGYSSWFRQMRSIKTKASFIDLLKEHDLRLKKD